MRHLGRYADVSWYVFRMVSRFWRLLSALVVLLPACSCATPQEPPSLRKFLREWAQSELALGDVKSTRYLAAVVHLQDDDAQQVIVYLIGAAWCGTGGCRALILVPKDSSYRVVTSMGVAQQPIRVLDTKSNGWHDLGVWVQGGGVQPGYEAKLSFDGRAYPSNPTVPPVQPVRARSKGTVVVPQSGSGEPLYP